MSLLSNYLQLGQATKWYEGGENAGGYFTPSRAIFQGSSSARLANKERADNRCISS